jgi:hypothetical protein
MPKPRPFSQCPTDTRHISGIRYVVAEPLSRVWIISAPIPTQRRPRQIQPPFLRCPPSPCAMEVEEMYLERNWRILDVDTSPLLPNHGGSLHAVTVCVPRRRYLRRNCRENVGFVTSHPLRSAAENYHRPWVKLYQEIFQICGAKHPCTTAYRQRGNGSDERLRTMTTIPTFFLRNFCKCGQHGKKTST